MFFFVLVRRVVVVFFGGTIRMKKETCIYLILPKGDEFWDSWILYFLVEVIKLTILQKNSILKRLTKLIISAIYECLVVLCLTKVV